LLLALRGGKENPDDKVLPGQLIWGILTEIDTPNPKFKKKGRHRLTFRPIGDRGAADLYLLQKRPNSWDIYSVATSDPSDFGDKKDLGPFRSAVYLAGTLKIRAGKISFARPKTKKIVPWSFDGLKVEAVAAPADEFKNAGGLSIATDDEFYNGIWRPIAKSRQTGDPSPLLFAKNARTGFALK
jgi:hypothetical protein